MSAYLRAISYYLPAGVYSNDDFYRNFPQESSNKKSLARVGVVKRHRVAPGITASDMAAESAFRLFKEHSIAATEIDFLLFCAQEFDHYTPTTACLIHEKLGLASHCGALDYNLGCSGFIYGLGVAKGLIESIGIKNVLLLTASTISKKIHQKDKGAQFIYGDAAAATLISAGNTGSIGDFIFGTDGKGADKIIVRDGGGRSPLSDKSFMETTDEFGNTTNPASHYMNGPAVLLFGLKTVPEMVQAILKKSHTNIQDIDLFIFHQANLFLIENIRKKLMIPKEKVFNYFKDVGNTISSTIPIALKEAIRSGKAKSGDTLLLAGFGVGFSWGATIIRL